MGLHRVYAECIACRAHAEDALRCTRQAAAQAWGKARRAVGLQEAVAPPLQEESSRGCSARLDADALEGIIARGAAWDGARETLRDVWRGHKEDPLKVYWRV